MQRPGKDASSAQSRASVCSASRQGRLGRSQREREWGPCNDSTLGKTERPDSRHSLEELGSWVLGDKRALWRVSSELTWGRCFSLREGLGLALREETEMELVCPSRWGLGFPLRIASGTAREPRDLWKF